MDAIDILTNEHRHIGRILDLLESAVACSRKGEGVSAVLFERVARFLLTFVEGSHDAKEDELFQAITAQGLPLSQGMLGALSGQHVLGREQAEALREAARAVLRSGGDPEGMYVCAEHYVRLLRVHTEMEETRLFPLVRRLLPAEVMERVRAKFARIEAAHGPLGDAADALELAFPLPAAEARRGMGPRAQPWGTR